MACHVIAPLIPYVQPGLQIGLQMGARWAAPRIGAAADKVTREAYQAREAVRKAAIENFEALSEDDLKLLDMPGETRGQGAETENEGWLIDISDEDEKDDDLKTALRNSVTGDGKGPKPIRLCCATIRASRNILETDGFGGPIPLLAHWSVEVDGVFYELRANPRGGAPAPAKDDGRIVLRQEPGDQDREIKLEITTNRQAHHSTRCYEVGTTIMDTDRIIKIALLIFRKFGQSYDLMIDNCQLFSQMLAEAIGGRENVVVIRNLFAKKSMMKIPVAGSWVMAPAYHLVSTVHHIARGSYPSSVHKCDDGPWNCVACSVGSLIRTFDEGFDQLEKFQYHPRIYGSRQQTSRDVDQFFEKLNPFK
ncbi:MAG: hypothetical protein M1814_002734 [Vezdaea aestivalis]|nr:MAG: hypothetical protein M1814_002734 [Vezdaea aestivalis]